MKMKSHIQCNIDILGLSGGDQIKNIKEELLVVLQQMWQK